jgi:prophage antirepressor-like protein
MSDMMENIFNNEEYGWKVRTVVEGSEVLFVAKDVADILGYSKTAAMTRTLSEDEKGVRNLHTLGGDQEMTVITESGLYAAILKSRRPEAEQFQKWVTGTVLHSIRKTGTYSETPQIRQTVDERLMDSLGRMVMVIEKHSDYLDRMVRVVEKNSDYLNRTSDFMIRSKFAEKDPVQDNPHLIPEPKRWAVSALIPRLNSIT